MRNLTGFINNLVAGWQRNPPARPKIALARSLFEQIISDLLHLKGKNHFYVLAAQNWTHFQTQILVQSEKIYISRNSNFPEAPIRGPSTDKNFRPDIKRKRAIKINPPCTEYIIPTYFIFNLKTQTFSVIVAT